MSDEVRERAYFGFFDSRYFRPSTEAFKLRKGAYHTCEESLAADGAEAPMSDEDLLANIAQGKTVAFVTFYDRHSPRVFGLLLRLLPNRTAAEDVLQEVFWQVWRSAGDYLSTRGAAVVWLRVLARSRAVDWRRKSNETPQPLEGLPSLCAGPLECAVRKESTERVRKAVAALTPDQADFLNLSFYIGLTHEEIARKLSIPLGTAKTRIRSALLSLRCELNGADERTTR